MSAKNPNKTPSYRLHKATGQALVELSGKRIYLGKHGTPESLQRYAREVAAWQANGRVPVVPVEDLTVAELCSQFIDFARDYYKKNGERTSEYHLYRMALTPASDLCGDLSVNQFGVNELRLVRDRMIQKGWNRRTINGAVLRVRRAFRWGAGQGIVAPSVVHALVCVDPLRRGRCGSVPESTRVKCVPDGNVDAIMPHLSPTVQTMVNLQRITGMRPGELTAMRGRDLDMSDATWVYTPAEHKTEHHDRERPIYLGPRSQELIRPYLKADLSAFLFRVDREPFGRFTPGVYRNAIIRACGMAWPVPDGVKGDAAKQWRIEHRWHPHQLRHNAATRLRREFGIEVARVTLGHNSASVTEIYAEVDYAKARDVMARVG